MFRNTDACSVPKPSHVCQSWSFWVMSRHFWLVLTEWNSEIKSDCTTFCHIIVWSRSPKIWQQNTCSRKRNGMNLHLNRASQNRQAFLWNSKRRTNGTESKYFSTFSIENSLNTKLLHSYCCRHKIWNMKQKESVQGSFIDKSHKRNCKI